MKLYSLPMVVVMACLTGSAPAIAAEIGVAAAVENQVTGTLGGVSSQLHAGNQIFQDQLVSTGADSAAQLLFLDETSFNLGPNSEVRLDQFIYDPASRTGKLALEASRGFFRFITGSADPVGYTLKTPATLIGFRGSVVDVLAFLGKVIVICVEPTVLVDLPDGRTIELAAGDAIVFLENGDVVGPGTWFDNYFANIGGLVFPFLGDNFRGTPVQIELEDGRFNIDQLNAEYELPPID